MVDALEGVSLLTSSRTGFCGWIPECSGEDGFRRLKPGLRTSEGLGTLGTLGCELLCVSASRRERFLSGKVEGKSASGLAHSMTLARCF